MQDILRIPLRMILGYKKISISHRIPCRESSEDGRWTGCGDTNKGISGTKEARGERVVLRNTVFWLVGVKKHRFSEENLEI